MRRIDPILLQATIAAALSFAHIHDIAAAAGQGGWKAWAYPVSVDLLMVMAWRRMRTGEGRAKKIAWFWFLLSLAASLGANVATSGVMDMEALPTWLRVLVAGWPAVAFLGGSLLVHKAAEEPAQEPQEAAGEPVVEPEPLVDDEPVEAPYAPILVTYAEAADHVGLSEVTVRGAANGGRLQKYDGDDPRRVYVDLRECHTVFSQSRQRAGV
ncbi:DUF2637 domain-containing protein [Streptomyces nitrosporeus]|uniref:DUF2637 domain-containing protein n=1 Tax=Streptomyces nitrosporeus TaxID=28894 RepID=UPI0019BCC82B|nr:DUF2637 domain-containing protein [Streptomyces nitrosporeus]GGY89044.1 hypothetical protein GCM10010327_19760 [Streptomyces nitrosporeus]